MATAADTHDSTNNTFLHLDSSSTATLSFKDHHLHNQHSLHLPRHHSNSSSPNLSNNTIIVNTGSSSLNHHQHHHHQTISAAAVAGSSTSTTPTSTTTSAASTTATMLTLKDTTSASSTSSSLSTSSTSMDSLVLAASSIMPTSSSTLSSSSTSSSSSSAESTPMAALEDALENINLHADLDASADSNASDSYRNQTILLDLEEGVRYAGSVKFFNSQKGYGFIIPDTKDMEVFVHHSAIANPKLGFRSLSESERVDFEIVQGDKGYQAANVTGPNGAPVLGDPNAHLYMTTHQLQMHHLLMTQQNAAAAAAAAAASVGGVVGASGVVGLEWDSTAGLVSTDGHVVSPRQHHVLLPQQQHQQQQQQQQLLHQHHHLPHSPPPMPSTHHIYPSPQSHRGAGGLVGSQVHHANTNNHSTPSPSTQLHRSASTSSHTSVTSPSSGRRPSRTGSVGSNNNGDLHQTPRRNNNANGHGGGNGGSGRGRYAYPNMPQIQQGQHQQAVYASPVPVQVHPGVTGVLPGAEYGAGVAANPNGVDYAIPQYYYIDPYAVPMPMPMVATPVTTTAPGATQTAAGVAPQQQQQPHPTSSMPLPPTKQHQQQPIPHMYAIQPTPTPYAGGYWYMPGTHQIMYAAPPHPVAYPTTAPTSTPNGYIKDDETSGGTSPTTPSQPASTHQVYPGYYPHPLMVMPQGVPPVALAEGYPEGVAGYYGQGGVAGGYGVVMGQGGVMYQTVPVQQQQQQVQQGGYQGERRGGKKRVEQQNE
ncbi:hypothetical protein HDU97_009462 [Phlyctochytrium planicorne]|nr:hypothetical protein HDU97_009462 [Phlyctochytrium planicorne]